MRQQELQEGKWYSLYPYRGENDKNCQWWMKSDGGNNGKASVYISWITHGGKREFVGSSGNLGGYEYTEATTQEAAWLAEIEKRKKYFPIEEFDPIINNYNIY